jgi:hypothetical protein
MAVVMAYQRRGYRLLASANCYVFEFADDPDIVSTSLPIGDGSTLNPGDCVTYIGGARTGAGYSRLHLIRGYLEYQGLRQDEEEAEGPAVLFRWSECQDRRILYGGYLVSSHPAKLIYSTQHVAARIIETTRVERTTPPKWNWQPGDRVEARRRSGVGIAWTCCTVIAAAERAIHVRFDDGTEAARPPADIRPAAVTRRDA